MPARSGRALPRYVWSALNADGHPSHGEIEAISAADARVLLGARGLSQVRVSRRRSLGRPAGLADIARFTRQLATMLAAGIPLPQAIALIAASHPNPRLARLFESVGSEVEAGVPLAQALRGHPAAFDALYCKLVEAGEQSGTLDRQLERLALHSESSLALRMRLRAAMRYPAVVLAVALAVMGMLLAFVVPAFRDGFASLPGDAGGASLPALTAAVIALSEAARAWWPLLLGLPLAAAWLARTLLTRLESAQRLRDRWCLRLPVAGALARQAATSRWTRTLSTLLGAGVPLVDALNGTARATGHWSFHDGTLRAAQAVSTGASLTHALRAQHLFDEAMLQMVRVAEDAAALDTLLARYADQAERELDASIGSLAGLVEPLVIVVLGVLIGGMVVAMYLPIFRLAQVF